MAGKQVNQHINMLPLMIMGVLIMRGSSFLIFRKNTGPLSFFTRSCLFPRHADPREHSFSHLKNDHMGVFRVFLLIISDILRNERKDTA